jgi:hypothetical protein
MKWHADWIWLPGERRQDYVYAHARREFDARGPFSEAKLHVTAGHIYRLYVNGAFVGRGPDRADPRFPYFDTYDVASLLRQGRNAIGLDLYAVTSEQNRGRSWCLYDGPPGLLLQLDYRQAGRLKRIGTDASWRMIESPEWRQGAPRITRFLAFVEHYDGRAAAAIAGFANAGYNDSRWEKAVELGRPPQGPIGDPLPRETPMLVRRPRRPRSVGSLHHGYDLSANETHHLGVDPDQPHTVSTVPGAPTAAVFDFGRTMGGLLRLRLENCRGGRVEAYYTENTRQVLCEVIELPETGDLLFESMDWRGARQVTLLFHDLPAPVALRSVEFVELDYPFTEAGDFEASDPLLGRIWRACRTTARVGVKDHPVDCVHREQALWYEDMYVHLRAAAACFGDLRPFEKGCRQGIRNVTDGGILPVPGPCGVGYDYRGESLQWSEQPLTLPMSVARLYELRGDPSLCAFAAPAVRRLMAHFAQYEDERGLIQVDKPGRQKLVVFTGWGAMLKQEGVPVNINAEYVLSMAAAAEVLRVAGDEAAARRFERRGRRAAEAVTRCFFSAADHLFIDGKRGGKPLRAFSPTANALAVLAGCLPPGEEGAWAWAMEHHPQLGDLASPFDASTALEAYLLIGADDQARRLLDECWGEFARRNEPCVPEWWMRGRDDLVLYGPKGTASRCHPYGAAPAYLLHQYVLGVRPAVAGYRKTTIEPHSLGLTLCRGRVPIPLGEIEVFWRRSETEWYLEATIPEGVEAVVRLPRFGWAPGRMTCDGEVVWADDGWRRFRADRWREPQTDVTPRVEAKVRTPGRHVVVLTPG